MYRAHTSSGRLPQEVTYLFNLKNWENGNGSSLGYYLSSTLNRVTSVSSQDVYEDWIFQYLSQKFVVTPVFESHITKFNLTLNTSIVAVDENGVQSGYSSGINSVYYDFLSGSTVLDSSTNTDNLYPIEEGSGLSPSVISDGGGSSNIYNAPNATATATGGNVTVNMGNNDPYHVEQVDYDNIGEVFDTVKRDMSRESGNGFFQVIAHVFAFIPSQIWQVLLTGITVITAVSVIRFVRNK